MQGCQALLGPLGVSSLSGTGIVRVGGGEFRLGFRDLEPSYRFPVQKFALAPQSLELLGLSVRHHDLGDVAELSWRLRCFVVTIAAALLLYLKIIWLFYFKPCTWFFSLNLCILHFTYLLP